MNFIVSLKSIKQRRNSVADESSDAMLCQGCVKEQFVDKYLNLHTSFEETGHHHARASKGCLLGST